MQSQQENEAQKNLGGRPKLNKNAETKYVGTKVDEPTRLKLEAAAQRLQLNMSDIVRSALGNWLEAYEKASKA